jgi:hypothetical protein
MTDDYVGITISFKCGFILPKIFPLALHRASQDRMD